MRVLLDHCVPRPLARLLLGHDVATAREMGWDNIGNGRLLALAAEKFDAMVTVDHNLSHQQNLSILPLPVIVLDSADSRFDALARFVPGLLALLDEDLGRQVYVLSQP